MPIVVEPRPSRNKPRRTAQARAKPGQTLLIKMYKGPKPDPMPDGMFDAHEVQAYLEGDPYGGHKDCKPGPDGKIICR
jgi:hypothetical protein